MANKYNVTKALLPLAEEFQEYTGEIFASHILTNNGPMVIRLENSLKEFLDADWLLSCSNGTIAIELALHASGAAGKRVITTPFTYVATASAPLWIGCEVIFADIDEETLAIDPKKIAALLTKNTAAILPVDIYGHACDFKAIAEVAGEIPVIYDAAQAFGAKLGGKSLFSFGDFATCSLHATKVFHTFEGGFIVCHSAEALNKLSLLRAFGHIGDNHICLGVNGKMSEIHAAMGLALLRDYEKHRHKREKISLLYDSLLNWTQLRKPAVLPDFYSNYAYYPVIFESESILSNVVKKLGACNIFPRRYFFPSLTTLPYIKTNPCPIAESVAKRVLCLPLYSSLPEEIVAQTAEIVNEANRV